MKLQFTHHAEYRIFYERNISTEEIKKVIRKPDISEHIQDNLIKSKRELGKRTLIVIYSKGRKNEYIIITAYFQ